MKGSITLPLCAALLCFVVPSARAEVKTETVEYKQDDTVLQGYLSYDTAVKGKRPAILIAHDWLGCTDYQKSRAEMLAALGYVALAGDLYGKGVRPANAKEASALTEKYYGDRALIRVRMKAGLDFLASQPQADTSRMAVIGYCFGGNCALELARSGAPLRAVVTLHGALHNPTPEDAKNIKAKVLVLHGADDPYVKPEEVQEFMDEMRKAGVDWQIVMYSGAVHSFTDKRAGSDNSKGAAYNEAADRRSWQAMKDLFAETLAP